MRKIIVIVKEIIKYWFGEKEKYLYGKENNLKRNEKVKDGDDLFGLWMMILINLGLSEWEVMGRERVCEGGWRNLGY